MHVNNNRRSIKRCGGGGGGCSGIGDVSGIGSSYSRRIRCHRNSAIIIINNVVNSMSSSAASTIVVVCGGNGCCRGGRFSANTRIGIVIRINDNIDARTMTTMAYLMVGATMIMAMSKICDGEDDDPCDEDRYDGYEGYAGFDKAYDDGGNGYDEYDDDEYDDGSQ